MKDFVHLHVHTMYSLLDGLCKLDELCQRAKELGMHSLAITDHGVMYGAIEFYQAANRHGIKPIIGVEGYIAKNGIEQKDKIGVASPYHLVLLAYNTTGYHNLLKLTTRAHLEGFYYKPRIDKRWLDEHSEGLIALSACLQGEIPRLLMAGQEEQALAAALEYQKIFGADNFFIEIERHEIDDQKRLNDMLIPFARKNKLPLVAANDVHYIYQEDWEPQDALICVQTGKTIQDTDRMQMTSHDFHLTSKEEMWELFKDLPEALENSAKIAERCSVDIEFNQSLLPDFDIPSGYSLGSYLNHVCARGLEWRYGIKADDDFNLLDQSLPSGITRSKRDAVMERIKYETSIIDQMGYSSYYLIVKDLVDHSREKDIPIGPGRGSGAGSMAAYLTGITNLDPIDHDLLFERFLNPERASMPDFDLDFADDRRDEMIFYTTEKYGVDHVAQIITFGSMKARAAIRDVGRVMGMSYQEVDKIAKMIPIGLDLQQALENAMELRLIYEKDPLVKKLIDLSLRLEGVARHASTHAAAVVVSKRELVQDVPLQRESKEGKITTQYSMKPCEEIGLLKIDFLGLKNLTILGNALKVIYEQHGLNIDLDRIPLDDKDVFNMLTKGETAGVFQVESAGMARLARDMKINSFDDIVALIALYRPGPMNMLKDYIQAKQGAVEPHYPHEILEPILKDTYGIAIYQEQVQQIACDFAGFSLGEGYLLIKAIGKKKIAQIKKMKSKFVKGAMESSNVSKDKATEVFSFIEPFARYGFNKSHAACYGLLTYQTAYLKAKYPLEYMTAMLTSEMSDQEKLATYITECQRMGFKVLGPDINHSKLGFSVEDGHIRFGLNGIKNVGEAAIDNIISVRQDGAFESLIDFCCRVCNRACNRKVMESLIKAGAFDAFGNRNQHLQSLDAITSLADKDQRAQDSGQISLFGVENAVGDIRPAFKLPDVGEVDLAAKLGWERELLGSYLSEHPLSMFEQNGMPDGFVTVDKIRKGETKKKIRMVGIVDVVRKIITKNKKQMAFVTLADHTDKIELVVFPTVFQANIEMWIKDQILEIKGKVDRKDDEEKIIVDEVTLFDQSEMESEQNIDTPSYPNTASRLVPADSADQILVLFLDERHSDTGSLYDLQKVIASCPGENSIQLVLHSSNPAKKKIIKIRQKVDLQDRNFLHKLQSTCGPEAVLVK